MMQFLLKTPPAIHICLPLSFDSRLFSSLPLPSVISLSLLFFYQGKDRKIEISKTQKPNRFEKPGIDLGSDSDHNSQILQRKFRSFFFSRKKKSVVPLKFVICSELQEHKLIMGQGWVRVRKEWWIPSKGVGAG